MVQKYLVTGASGYIAMHVIDQLLKEGHSVRGTIRSLNDKEKVDAIKKLGPVELFEANLDDTEPWKKAVKGIDIVLHIATPTTDSFTMEENVAIKQAVDGKI
jgi:dihydroflavonol-4-reductase